MNWMRWNPVWMQVREGFDGEGFREAGHAFEQDVAVGEQADEETVHEVFLADDDAAQFVLQRGDPVAVLLHGVGEFLGGGHGRGR